MKKHFAVLFVFYSLFAAPAIAAPCVGAAYNIPFPGSVDVNMHHADVPAAHFPGIWQDGRIDGHFYQIFANRSAVLQADRIAPAWSINVNCQQRPCTITVAGNAPTTALSTSQRLEQCLVPLEIKTAAPLDTKSVPSATASSNPAPAKAAQQASSSVMPAPDRPVPAKPALKVEATGSANPAPDQKLPPKVDATAQPGTVAKTDVGNIRSAEKFGAAPLQPSASHVTKPAPKGQRIVRTGNAGKGITCPRSQDETTLDFVATCRPVVIAASDPVAMLQQLLFIAGADPGGVDGRYGSRTKEAVLDVLGYRGRNLDVFEAIDAIDAFLCGQEPFSQD